MSDVLERLRLANPIVDVDAVDSAEYARALAEIEDRWEFGAAIPRIPTSTRPAWWRPALVAAAAAALIILAIAVPVLFIRGDRQPVTETTVPPSSTTTEPVTTTQATTTTAPTTTTTTTVPAPVAAPPLVGWERVPDDPMFHKTVIWSVANGGPGLIASGGSYTDDGLMIDGIVWVSSNGIAWDRIDDPSFASPVPDEGIEYGNFGSGIRDVASGPSGIIGVGFVGNDGAIWHSPDGIEWTRINDSDLQRDGLMNLFAVTAGGPGWVAVGDFEMDGGIWVSEDGLDWIRVEDDDLAAGDRVDATVYDVAAWGDGLIAVGALGIEGGSDDREERGAIWVSDDGLEWTELVDDLFWENRVFEGVTVDPTTNTVFALGSPGGIVMSTDGETWTLNADEGPPPGSGSAWDGERAVAGGPDLALSLWVSDDSGMMWHLVDSDDAAFEGYNPGVNDVALFGDRFVVVGSAGEYTQEVGAVWIGTWDE